MPEAPAPPPFPPAEGASAPRTGRGGRWRRRLARSFVGFLALLVVLYLSREVTLHPLLVRGVGWATEGTGYDVSVADIDGDWASELSLTDVRVTTRADAQATPVEVELSEVALSFGIVDLVRGGLDGLDGILVRGGRIEADLSEPGAEAESEPSQGSSLPTHLPALTIEDVDVALTLPDARTVTLEDLAVETDGARYELTTRAAAEDPVLGALRFPLGVALDRVDDAWVLNGLRLAERVVAFSAALDDRTASVALELPERALASWHQDLSATERTVEGELALTLNATVPLADPLATVATGRLLLTSVRVDDRPIDRLDARFSVEEGTATVEGGALEIPGGRATIENGSVDLDDPGLPFELDLEASFEELAGIGTSLGAPEGGWRGSLEGSVRVRGDRERFEGTATCRGAGVAVQGVELGAVSFRAVADGSSVRIEELIASGDGRELAGGGTWWFEEARFEGLRLTASVADLASFDALRDAPDEEPAPEEELPARWRGGPLEAELLLDGPWTAPRGSLRVQLAAAELGGTPVDSVALEAAIADGRIRTERLEVVSPYGALSSSLHLTWPGASEPLQLGLDALELSRDDRSLRLVEPVVLTLGGEELVVGPLSLQGNVASGLDVELRSSAGSTSVRLDARALELTPFLGLLPAGTLPEGAELSELDAALAFDRTADAWTVDGSITAGRWIPAADRPALALALDGALRDGVLELRRATLRQGEEELVALEARVPIDPAGPVLFPGGDTRVVGRFALPSEDELTLPVAPAADGAPRRLTGELQGEVALEGPWDALAGSVRVEGRELALAPRLEPYLVDANVVSIDVQLGDQVEIERLALDLPERGTLEGRGRVEHVLDLGAWTAGGEPAASWGAAPLVFSGAFELADIGWVAQLSETLRRASGRARGTLELAGTVLEPEPTATLELTGGSLKIGQAQELTAVSLRARVADAVLELEELAAEVGSSPLVARGTLALDETRAIDLKLVGEDVLLTRSKNARFRADVDLNLRGPQDALRLEGAVALRYSTILQDIDLLSGLTSRSGTASSRRGIALPSIRSEPFASMELDVRVTTQEPVRILTNLARGQAAIDLHVGGTGEVLVPTGRVFLDGVQVDLPGGPMRFETGLVTFEETRPEVPTLNLVGAAKLAGYEVQLAISGPYDDLEILGSSQPPLATSDLYLLVLTGQVPASGDRTSAAAQSLGVYLAKDLLQRWSGGPSDEESFLDRIEILSGREVSRSGVMTMEVSYRWLDGIARAQDALLLVAERDRFEDINMGLRFVFRSR